LLFHRDLINLILGFELVNLHSFVEFEVAVLAPHAAIQQLVEVDITVVAANAHLEHDLLKLVLRRVLRQAQRHGKFLEKVVESFFAELETAVPLLSEVDPGLHENFQRVLELEDGVVV
jgi:alanyl-tRNA synthetase